MLARLCVLADRREDDLPVLLQRRVDVLERQSVLGDRREDVQSIACATANLSASECFTTGWSLGGLHTTKNLSFELARPFPKLRKSGCRALGR